MPSQPPQKPKGARRTELIAYILCGCVFVLGCIIAFIIIAVQAQPVYTSSYSSKTNVEHIGEWIKSGALTAAWGSCAGFSILLSLAVVMLLDRLHLALKYLRTTAHRLDSIEDKLDALAPKPPSPPPAAPEPPNNEQ